MRRVPSTLASHIQRHLSSTAASILSTPTAPPALLTSRLMDSGRLPAKDVTLASSVMSRGSGVARLPIESATCRRRSWRRAPRKTWNPAVAKARAVAAPIPELAPVTTAVLIILDLRRGAQVGHLADGTLRLARLADL